MNRQDRNVVRLYARYAQLAFVLPVSTFTGWALGAWIDSLLGTHFFYLALLLLGITGGIIHLVRELNKDERRQ
jgi:F0F1-type ATP synthase assembly protein I